MVEAESEIYSAVLNLGFERPLLTRLSGGRNSRVWKVSAGIQTAVVKQYFNDAEGGGTRLKAECDFLEFLAEKTFRTLPKYSLDLKDIIFRVVLHSRAENNIT